MKNNVIQAYQKDWQKKSWKKEELSLKIGSILPFLNYSEKYFIAILKEIFWILVVAMEH